MKTLALIALPLTLSTLQASGLRDFNYQPKAKKTQVSIDAYTAVTDYELTYKGIDLAETSTIDKSERLEVNYGITDNFSLGINAQAYRQEFLVTGDEHNLDLFENSSLKQGENLGLSLSYLHQVNEFSFKTDISHQFADVYDENKASNDFSSTELSLSSVYTKEALQVQFKYNYADISKGKYSSAYNMSGYNLNAQYSLSDKVTPFIGFGAITPSKQVYEKDGIRETLSSEQIGTNTFGLKFTVKPDVMITLYRDAIKSTKFDLDIEDISLDQRVEGIVTGLKLDIQF